MRNGLTMPRIYIKILLSVSCSSCAAFPIPDLTDPIVMFGLCVFVSPYNMGVFGWCSVKFTQGCLPF